MKTIIVYASKNGTTEKCVLKLKNYIGDVDVVNLLNENPSIDSYDKVIIGSAVRMGTLMKEVRKFIHSNEDKLKGKKYGIFVCNGFVDKTDEVIKANLSSEVIKSAIAIMSFGGELDINKLKGMDKFITKIVSKNGNDTKVCEILENNIIRFVSLMK